MIFEKVKLLSLVFELKLISYDYFVILKVRKKKQFGLLCINVENTVLNFCLK